MPRDNKAPYFPFYPDDFASDGKVEAMSTEEVGAYILLLCKAWREEPIGSIPDDDRTLARWSRMTPERWADCKQYVLAPFESRADGRLYQPRLVREHQKFATNRRTRSKAAKTAAQARWGNNNASRMRDACDSHSERNAISCLSSSSSSSSPPDGGCGGEVNFLDEWAKVRCVAGCDESASRAEKLAAKESLHPVTAEIIKKTGWEQLKSDLIAGGDGARIRERTFERQFTERTT